MVGQELHTNPQIIDNSSTTEFILSCFQSVSLHQRAGDKRIIPSWVCVKSWLSSVKITEMHVAFLPFIPKPVTEYLTVYTSMLNFVKIVLYQYSVTKKFSKFLLLFTSKGKMNFRSLFKCLIDFIQPSVLNIALTSILKDLGSREVSDRKKSLMRMF